MSNRTAGVVGLGGMGKALAEALLNADHPLAVWDRHTDRVATTAMIGASPTSTPRELAEQANVIFLALPHAEAVREVLYDETAGLLSHLGDNSLIVDMTTGDRELAKEVSACVKEIGNGSLYVDAPVSGKAPKLTVMVGGSAGVLGEDEAMVADIAGKVIYTGALGDGFATKLIHQHVKYATHLAVAEALIIAEKAGLDTTVTIDALESSTGAAGGQRSATEYFTGNKRAMRSHAPNKTIAKDMRQALALAESVHVASATLAATGEFFAAAADGEGATQPYPESIALLAQLRTGELDTVA